MKKQYNVVVTERLSVARSKRLREAGQSSGAVARLSGGGGGGGSVVVTGSAALESDIPSNAPKTGHIETGQKLPKGMTFTQFVKALLFKPVPATLVGRIYPGNDVEYGTAKDRIEYTATRNGNGIMKSAYLENNPENKLAFSVEANGIQTATRKLTGIYTTDRETYIATAVYAASEDKSIPDTTLTSTISVNVHRKWFAGVCSSIPTSSSQVRALGSSGFYTGANGYNFNVGKWTKMVICIPSGNIGTVIKEGTPGNYLESAGVYRGMRNINVEGAGNSQAIPYNMYVFEVDIESDEAKFTFNTVK